MIQLHSVNDLVLTAATNVSQTARDSIQIWEGMDFAQDSKYGHDNERYV